MGGFDFVKDDENDVDLLQPLRRQGQDPRKNRDKPSRVDGERKSAFLNITADTATMEQRASSLPNTAGIMQ